MCFGLVRSETRCDRKEGTPVRFRRIVYSLGWLAAIALAVSAGWKNS
jgi:hypothetical protein